MLARAPRRSRPISLVAQIFTNNNAGSEGDGHVAAIHAGSRNKPVVHSTSATDEIESVGSSGPLLKSTSAILERKT